MSTTDQHSCIAASKMGVQEIQDRKHIEHSRDCGACRCIALGQSSTLILKAESDGLQEHYERTGYASSARMLLMCACLTAAATSLAGWRMLPQISWIHRSAHMIFWASPDLISSILSLASLLGAAFICTGISSMQLASLRRALRLTSIMLAFSLAFMAAAFSTRIAVEDTA